MAALIIICAAALVIFAVYRTVQKARGKAKSSCCGTPEVITKKKVEDTDESHYPYRYKLAIEGMRCSNCAATVENTLDEIDGIWARVNLGKKEADVLSKQEMQQADFARVMGATSYKLVGFEAVQK